MTKGCVVLRVEIEGEAVGMRLESERGELLEGDAMRL